MASYLATATIGNFKLQRSRVAGLESVIAVDRRERRDARRALSKTGHIVRFLRSLFGPYPFGEVGAIVDHAPEVGYALETQTRPIFDQAPDDVTLAHELAHQWFGDSVSLRTWPEMWLNEGFATWAEWRWTEGRGGMTTKQQFDQLMGQPAHSAIWTPPPAAIPEPSVLFADSVYVRGAMALEALRQRIGDAAFLQTMRGWAMGHAYGNATIADFTALAEAQSGQDLDSLFQKWLYDDGKPSRAKPRSHTDAGRRRAPASQFRNAAAVARR
jgi:aminopeptidase N